MSAPGSRARSVLRRATQLLRERPTLLDALICGQLGRYTLFRLRPLLVYRLLGLLAHLAELLLLMRLFPSRALVTSVVLNNVCALGSAFFWGALEPARQSAHRARSSSDASALANPYLSLTAILGALCALGSVAKIAASHGSVVDLYAAALLLRMVLDTVTRALQLPIAAHTRVYRPRGLMLLRPVIAPLVLFGAWDLFGPRSLPLSVAISALAQFALTAAYTLRTYQTQNLPLPQPRLRHLQQLARAAPLREQLWAGLAGALPMSASLMICALVVIGASRDSHRSMLVVLHALLPLFQSAGGWAQITYVDLHWLLKPWRAAMRRRYERALEKAAPLIALALLPWIAAIAFLLTHRSTWIWTLASAPLLWTQAWSASLQIRLFVRARFRALAAFSAAQMALVLLATAIVSRLVLLRGAGIALVCAAVELAMLLALRRHLARVPERTAVEARRDPEVRSTEPVPLSAWIALLACERAPVLAGVLVLKGASGGRLQALVSRLEALSGIAGSVASAGPTRIVFFARASAGLSRTQLLVAGAGVVQQILLVGPSPSGADALRALRAQAILPALPEADRPATAPRTGELSAADPGALIIDLTLGVCPPEVRALPSGARRRLYASAERAARGLRRQPDRSALYDVIAEHPGGVLTRVVLFPWSAPAQLRSELRRLALCRALAIPDPAPR